MADHRRIFADGIYTRKELTALVGCLSEDSFWELEELFGLHRISHSPVEYLGEHVLQALKNRAIGRIVDPIGKPLTRDEIRAIRKAKVK